MTRRPVIVLPAILAAIPSGTSPALCHLLRRNANRLVIDKLTPRRLVRVIRKPLSSDRYSPHGRISNSGSPTRKNQFSVARKATSRP